MEENNNNQIIHVDANPAAVAEIESQIATAKKYPRNLATFKDRLMSLANLDQSTAEGCYYAVPRAGKTISGPSIRFAEIALSCYGNAVAQADVIGEDDKYIYAMGMCRDLENNVAVRMKLRRRITNKHGVRFKDDMIATTANAVCAIALRNVIFKIVPAAFTKAAFDQVKRTAVGDAESFATTRAETISRLGKLGVDEERILYTLGRPSVDEITISDVADLIGLGTAIHDGEATLDEVFPKPMSQETGSGGLKERLKNDKKPPEEPVDPKIEAKKKRDIAKMKAADKEAKAKKEAGKTEALEPEEPEAKYSCLRCSQKFPVMPANEKCTTCLGEVAEIKF